MITLNKKHQTIPVLNQTSKITQEQVKAQSQLQSKQAAPGFRGDEGTSQLAEVNKALMVSQNSEDEKIKDLAFKLLDFSEPEIIKNFLKAPVSNPPKEFVKKEFVELVEELSKPEIANKVGSKLEQVANKLDKDGLDSEKKEFLNTVREAAQSLKYSASLTKEMQGHGSSKLAFTGRREELGKKVENVFERIDRNKERAESALLTWRTGRAFFENNPAKFAELAAGILGDGDDPASIAILQRVFRYASDQNLRHISGGVIRNFLQSDAFDAFLNNSEFMDSVVTTPDIPIAEAADTGLGHFSDFVTDVKGIYDFGKGIGEIANGDIEQGVSHIVEGGADVLVGHSSTAVAGAAAVKGAMIGSVGGPVGAAAGAIIAGMGAKIVCSKGWKKCKKWLKDNW